MTLLYEVSFMSYGEPDPSRLGTAPTVGVKLRLWAANGDEAVTIARRVASEKHMEWLGMLDCTAITGVIREQILNDPTSGYVFQSDGEPTTETTTPAEGGPRLVTL